jgi:hypothetical protein
MGRFRRCSYGTIRHCQSQFFLAVVGHDPFASCGTYRASDNTGGSNGARMRFHPEADYGNNAVSTIYMILNLRESGSFDDVFLSRSRFFFNVR